MRQERKLRLPTVSDIVVRCGLPKLRGETLHRLHQPNLQRPDLRGPKFRRLKPQREIGTRLYIRSATRSHSGSGQGARHFLFDSSRPRYVEEPLHEEADVHVKKSRIQGRRTSTAQHPSTQQAVCTRCRSAAGSSHHFFSPQTLARHTLYFLFQNKPHKASARTAT